ncbi:MAG: N-6 DNA methylase [Pseudolysinimonas sp.]|uniref:N-6 DNA methylase n=1 Tax=Pseudolysinimonas sp. TaxID=2680009 RepID=UPI003C710B82
MSGASCTIAKVKRTASTPTDTPALRKARGAFFTPPAIAQFITSWAVRGMNDRVLEPSAGDAAFLVPAVLRLRDLAFEVGEVSTPTVYGVEIHALSASEGSRRIVEAGGKPSLTVRDFFDFDTPERFDAVVGNPPFIRYQDFSGEARGKARAAALRAGVEINGLASSWAAFVVHATTFLAPGGRLGFVLPAELLSVNYAGPIRKFLFDSFASVDLVLFTERVFPEAEADVVLLLADGYGLGPTDHAQIKQAQNAESLATMSAALRWSPSDPASKWTPSLLDAETLELYSALLHDGHFTEMKNWGSTTLGAVTGNNGYFALSAQNVREMKLEQSDVTPLSPPGSRHLRGLSYGSPEWKSHLEGGARGWLFRPTAAPSRAALRYIHTGERDGVDQAFKCRVRSPWWRVPLVPKADLFLTYMNADSVRISANTAGVRHLNSVHGITLAPDYRRVGKSLLAMGSLSAMTLLGAEMMGRAYGGGLLKIEPREADMLPMPSLDLLKRSESKLKEIAPEVRMLLEIGDLIGASTTVDRVLFAGIEGAGSETSAARLREARAKYLARRVARSSYRMPASSVAH